MDMVIAVKEDITLAGKPAERYHLFATDPHAAEMWIRKNLDTTDGLPYQARQDRKIIVENTFYGYVGDLYQPEIWRVIDLVARGVISMDVVRDIVQQGRDADILF